jgi:anti-sigma factor RsiW
MSCTKLGQRLSLYVDRMLSPWARRRVEAHLSRCNECAQTVREIRNLKVAAAAVPDPTPPDGFWERIYAGLPEEPERAPTIRPSFATRRAAILWVPAVVATIVTAAFTVLPRQQPNPDADIQALVVEHASYRAQSPLADRGRLEFVMAQVSQDAPEEQ